MARGTIQRLMIDKGFGFLKGDDENIERFFHRSAVQPRGAFEQLGEGEQVEFEPEHSPKGPRAENIRVVE